VLNTDFQHVIAVGDSFTSHPYDAEAFAYADYLQLPARVDNFGVPSTTLVADIAPGCAACLARAPSADAVILQGGLNDLARWQSNLIHLRSQLWRMQRAVVDMLILADTAGLNVLLINVAAWQEFAPWTPARQVLTEHYNGWLGEFCQQIGVPMVDIYALLQDCKLPLRMDATKGGPLHPNERGAKEIAAAVDARIAELRRAGRGSRPNGIALRACSVELAASPKPPLWWRLQRRLAAKL
jgi:lysophospholipase L1-like esterase